jgi:hypothetical protein
MHDWRAVVGDPSHRGHYVLGRSLAKITTQCSLEDPPEKVWERDLFILG